jgi:hypothetical protein
LSGLLQVNGYYLEHRRRDQSVNPGFFLGSARQLARPATRQLNDRPACDFEEHLEPWHEERAQSDSDAVMGADIQSVRLRPEALTVV